MNTKYFTEKVIRVRYRESALLGDILQYRLRDDVAM